MKKTAAVILVFLLSVFLMTGCLDIAEYTGSSQTGSSRDSSSSRQYDSVEEESRDDGASGTDAASGETVSAASSDSGSQAEVTEDGEYTSKDEVALYIHLYGRLPSNYITKKQAQELGWDSSSNTLDEVAPGKSIGGSHYGNYQGILPDGSYKECDIDYKGGRRNAKRIIYSADGRIYYTDDHYKTFTQLY